MATTVTVPGFTWAWEELDPTALGGSDEWSHPGLAALADGGVRAFDQTTAQLVDLDADGHVTRRVPTDLLLGHGLAVGTDGRTWIADPGIRSRLVDGTVHRREGTGGVTAVAADGTTTHLAAPRHARYAEKPYRPTSIAVERPDVPESPVWVADGYGGSLVHRYDGTGLATLTLDGTPSGSFDCPHAVEIDRRGAQPTLLVADRGNALVHRFDLDGRHISTIGPEGFTTPSAFAIAGEVLLVAELRGRIAVLDGDDRVIGHLGDGSVHVSEAGWPNERDGEITRRRSPLEPGRFIAPHGITVLRDGRVLIGEWVIGGRVVRLTPVR